MSHATLPPAWILVLALCLGPAPAAPAEVLAQVTSAYHQIKVVDEGGYRLLSFDGSLESRMSLQNPLEGHFEYTHYFHMPWLWNRQIKRVLMVGLGGATTQRAFAHHYPGVTIETVELDSYVVTLAKQYFHYKTSPRQLVRVGDGRQYLRRSPFTYDLVIMDAYSRNRYGTFLPHHLATREFFELVEKRLSENGVLCYNVMGTIRGSRADLVAALFKTMQAVFPRVYLFPALESDNVVLLATKDNASVTLNKLHQRAARAVRDKIVTLPGFRDRVYVFRRQPPYASQKAPLLTDDYAPIEGLMGRQNTEAHDNPASSKP